MTSTSLCMFHSRILSLHMDQMLLDLQSQTITQKIPQLQAAAISLAAACVCICLIGIVKEYLSEKQISWSRLSRPLVLFLLVCNFSGLVLSPLESLTGLYGSTFSEVCGSSIKEFKQMFRQKAIEASQKYDFEYDEDTAEKESSSAESSEKEQSPFARRIIQRVSESVTREFYSIERKYTLGLSELLSGLMFFILNLEVSVMRIIAGLLLIIVSMIGPFTFALSIIPAFSSGIISWIRRYIQITLWTPLLHMVMFIGTKAMTFGVEDLSGGAFWMWIFIDVSIFILIRSIPSIASWIVEGIGAENLASKLSPMGQTNRDIERQFTPS